MQFNLIGKNALVCGASRGIGNAIAKQFAALGANVTLVSRSRAILERICQRPWIHHVDNNMTSSRLTLTNPTN